MAKVFDRAIAVPAGPPTAERRWRGRGARTAARQALSIALFVAVWSAVAAVPWAIRIPSALDVARAALALDPRVLAADLALSFYRVGLGFLIAVAIGVPLGIAIGYSRRARDLLFPSVEVFRPIPPIAWIPLAILFFPQMEWMIVFLTCYGAFFPIVYNTVEGVAGIRSTYVRAGKSLGASDWTLFWHVILPAALPVIFTGLYIAVGVAWLMVVAGEMMASRGGIGAMTWEAYQTTQYPRIFVGMAAIGLLGYLSSLIIRGIARLVVRWEVS